MATGATTAFSAFEQEMLRKNPVPFLNVIVAALNQGYFYFLLIRLLECSHYSTVQITAAKRPGIKKVRCYAAVSASAWIINTGELVCSSISLEIL